MGGMILHSRRRNHSGMTLLELLLALAITGIIGMAVAAMLGAMSYGTSSERDIRSLVVRHKTTTARLSAMIRGSRLVLQTGTDYLVLWMHDDRSNDLPNLSEICRLERDSDGRLWAYQARFAAGLTAQQIEAADVSYAFNVDFNATTNALKAGSDFPGELWANGVTAWSVTVHPTPVQDARLVQYRMTLAAGSLSDIVIGAAALRNRDQ